MSFRARLTTFFVLIVVIPMAAMGVLVFGLINDSASSKADARVAGIADTAASVYQTSSTQASLDARSVARALALTPPAQLARHARALARQTGLARIVMRVGDGPRRSVGDPTAVAPGIAIVRAQGDRPQRSFSVSQLSAAAFARQLAGSGIAVVVRQDGRTLGATLPAPGSIALPAARGTVAVGSHRYLVITERFAGFAGRQVSVSVLSDLAATGGSLGEDRLLAATFIAGFLVLAFFFTLLASRGLQAQVSRFLDAARRLGSGDFSAPVQTVGHDEFAALGEEFNSMSRQLQHRLDELEQERARVRSSIRRIGEAFASGLDREALLELALRTAMDATGADRGRVSARSSPEESLIESDHVGRLAGLESELYDAERRALEGGDGEVGQVSAGEVHLASVALGPMAAGAPSHGVITVSREGRQFSADDVELLRSLAIRATLALANVAMHADVARQAVTDDLTGLASHGHFQELLAAELAEVARYEYPTALAMFDIDNFKFVNDTYGHQQGDLVLRRVADVLRETCRDADVPARYGGEEMVLILPHTDLEGAVELAERARTAIERLAVPRLDHKGWLKITSSVGVAVSCDGRKDALIGAADSALYAAKRSGKNRTMRADANGARHDAARELADAANVVDGE
jgi:diguanylate cyclase (GGDEF)-like protein